MAIVTVQNFYKVSNVGRRLAYLISRKYVIATKVSRIRNITLKTPRTFAIDEPIPDRFV